MLNRLLRSAWNNIGTLMLALALAFAVWISAVVAEDPNQERNFPRALELEVRNQNPAMLLLGELPSPISVRLSAPSSLWDRLTSEPTAVKVYLDLEGLEAGEHTLAIQVETGLRPVRIVQITPEEVTIELETRASRELPVTLEILGAPALGFNLDEPVLEPARVAVSGPQSLVADVDVVRALLDVTDANETISQDLALQALDAQGNVLSGLTIEPTTVAITQPLLQEGGYRVVSVVVEPVGLQATGFRVTNITVTPPIVTLYSSDPQLVVDLPGFVSTLPLDISGAEADIEIRLALDLPEGVQVVGEEQNVLVRIGIAPIETSIVLNIDVEVAGLGRGLVADISPQTVGVILSGPLAVLDNLQSGDVRLLVDLTDLGKGVHLLEPQAEILPDGVQVLSITPSSIEVVISAE